MSAVELYDDGACDRVDSLSRYGGHDDSKIVIDNAGTPDGLSLAGGASSVSTVMSCNVRVTMPRFGGGSIVIYNAQRSTAGGARCAARSSRVGRTAGSAMMNVPLFK